MNINRHNYEEYFLLYVDNELNIVQRKAVDAFIAENPDLKAELLILQESVLPADEHIVFSNKESLLRTATAPNPVNETNCEEYFVLYADDELTNEQKDLVEQFVYRNPQHQANFELLQQVKLMPDTSVIFPNKYALYRKEDDDRVVPVIPMRWWKMAAAAAVLLFIGGMGWYMNTKPGTTPSVNGPVASFNDTSNSKPSPTQQPKEIVAGTNTQKDQQQAPEVIVTNDQQKKDQQKKEATPQQPAIKLPVKAVNAVDIADNTQKEKNNAPQRNIPVKINVPLIEDTVQQEKPETMLAAINVVPKKVETTPILTKTDLPAKGTETPSISNKTAAVDTDNNPDIGNTYASTDDKKNKMRGFFRKVSRVFEKTANIDADGKERSGIRIASFEIALK
jgi:hypothetical protein